MLIQQELQRVYEPDPTKRMGTSLPPQHLQNNDMSKLSFRRQANEPVDRVDEAVAEINIKPQNIGFGAYLKRTGREEGKE